jgi:hypothetical protein
MKSTLNGKAGNVAIAVIGIISASALISGCGSVIRQVDVQNAKVSGPMNHPPVTITMDSARGLVRFSPRFTLNRNRRLTGSIDGESSSDPAKAGSLQWRLPGFTIGLGSDFGLGRSGCLSLGGEYGHADGHDAWNAYAGVGIRDASSDLGCRVEAGICYRSLRHDARTVVESTYHYAFWGSSTRRIRYHDCGDDRAFDFYTQMTLNTKSEQSPVNLFVCTGLTRQTLLKYRPRTTTVTFAGIPVSGTESGTEAACRVLLFSLTPGLAFNLGEHHKALAGWRMTWPWGGHLDPKPVVSPFMQLDFVL